MKRKKINYQLLLRRVCLIVLDIFLIILSSLMALATRFEFDVRQIPEEFFSVLLDYGVLMIFMTLIVFGVFRIYSSLWEYAGLEETFKIIGAVVFSSLCDMAIVVGMGKHLPRSYYVIRTFYLIALVGGSRFFYRLIRLRYRKRQHYSIKKKKKIMLIGAGEAGRTLIQEIQNSRYLDQKICCVIDDNRRKIGRYILGIRVVGDRNAIKRIVVIVVLLGIVIAINQGGHEQEPSTEQTDENETVDDVQTAETNEEETEPSEETDTGLEFPYLLDDDKIQIDSLFQYSGINMDAQNEECEDVASLQLKNNSDQYLEKAEISVELTDGTAFSFEVEDIPAGKSVMAFDTANTAYDGKTGVALIDATTTYSSDAGLKETDVKITSDDNGVQLENISGDVLANLKIKYHCVMDDMYFGGISSETEVAGLAAGETTTVDTSESILGDAEVVSITY